MQVQALGLATEYRSPSGDLKAFVQMMAAVAFCPLTYVRPAWLAIQQSAPNIPRVDELIDYSATKTPYEGGETDTDSL